MTSPQPAHIVSAGATPYASPSVRLYARELGVDLAQIFGTGPLGRIRRTDVQGFVREAVARGASAPSVSAQAALPTLTDFASFGRIETAERTARQNRRAAEVTRSWLSVPHVTNSDWADLTETEALCRQWAVDQTGHNSARMVLALAIKASASALRNFEDVNASLDGDRIILKRYCHIAFAVVTRDGWEMPVIRDADRKSILEIAGGLAELTDKALAGDLRSEDSEGACFSVTSLYRDGGAGHAAFGGFTPIVRLPEIAHLGVSSSCSWPVWSDGKFTRRAVAPLHLSWDHRAIDGALAARFLRTIIRNMEGVREMAG